MHLKSIIQLLSRFNNITYTPMITVDKTLFVGRNTEDGPQVV